MFTNQISSVALLSRSAFSSFAFAVCMVLSFGLSVNAQNPGSSHDIPGEGSNTIQGRIYLPAGQSMPGSAFRVRLESNNVFSTPSTATDQDGAFRFNSLPPGAFTVVVDGGKEYETSREPVNLDRAGGGRVVTVAVQMRLKVNSSNPAFANVPPAAIDLYQKGMAAAQKGNAKSAVELLDKAVIAYPGFTLALNELGIQHLKLSQWDKAAAAFEGLVKLNPNDATTQLNLGIAFFNQNKLDQAETHLREALKLKSNGPSAHYYLGMALVKTQRYEEAEKELQLTVSNGGENIALVHKYLGGLYLRTHKNSAAVDELEKYLRLDPKAADAERIKNTIKDLRAKP